MTPYRFIPGPAPLLISMPHAGIELPAAMAETMDEPAKALPDTDWHLDRLYDFAAGLGANQLIATQSRYLIDLNRPPDDTGLYPGQVSTGLCPAAMFDGRPIYRAGRAPDAAEIKARLKRYWRPYHDRIAAALAAIKQRHGFALLYEAHSIRSRVPRLFDGRLPDINIGTANGAASPPELGQRLLSVAQGGTGFSAVLNGRFVGGYITRAYGEPAAGVHAVQVELVQATYMDELPPFAFDESRATRIRPVLAELLRSMLDWGAEQRGRR